MSDTTYKKINALSIHIQDTNAWIVHGLQMINTKGVISTGQKIEESDLPSLIKALGKSDPYVLNLSGKGIIDKRVVDLVPGQKNIISNAFPGLSISDYYSTEFVQGHVGWAALTKISLLDPILDQLNQLGISIIGVSLGLSSPSAMINLLDPVQTSWSSGTHQWEINSGSVENISPSSVDSTVIDTGNEKLEAQFLLAYSAGLNYLLQNDLTLKENDTIQQGNVNHTYLSRSRKVLTIGLGIILSAGLANAYFFNQYYQHSQALQFNISTQKTQLDQVEDLKEQYEELRTTFGDISSNTPQHAYFVDQIGASLPEKQILLTAIEIFPITSDKRMKNQGDYQVDQDMIIIDGISKNPKLFGDWIAELRALDWIKSVDITPFVKNAAGENEFRVEVGV